jgi:hypothetical protein
MDQYIKITSGNGKMQFINSINTNTLTNDYCMTICSFKGKCYSRKQINRWQSNGIGWQKNSDKLSQSIIDYDLLPKFYNTNFVRFHSHGELINDTHLINFMNICNKNKDVTFTLFTKRSDLIKRHFKNHKKPKNLILIFSNSKFDKPMDKIPLHFDKTFNVINKDSNIKANCSGKCKDCMICYTIGSKETQIIEVIK